MFTSIITQSSGVNMNYGSMSIQYVLICTAVSIFLGLGIASIYMLQGGNSKNFSISVAILPVVIQVVIMMVNGNLGTGVAVAGAFSLVRFRSVPGNSKEICFVFFSMAIGLATGMGFIAFAVCMAVIIGVLLFVLSKSKFGEIADSSKVLKITIPENLDYGVVFDDIFESFTSMATLEKVKTVNLGSMYELTYRIKLKCANEEKKMIDELRCRNGNLTIICSRPQIGKEQL